MIVCGLGTQSTGNGGGRLGGQRKFPRSLDFSSFPPSPLFEARFPRRQGTTPCCRTPCQGPISSRPEARPPDAPTLGPHLTAQTHPPRAADRHLLALLDEHQVLIISQLVRLTDLPARTVQHRLPSAGPSRGCRERPASLGRRRGRPPARSIPPRWRRYGTGTVARQCGVRDLRQVAVPPSRERVRCSAAIEPGQNAVCSASKGGANQNFLRNLRETP